jgi:hypothetical protein
MLMVDDRKVVAYGYDFDRRTINCWFEGGKFHRCEYTGSNEHLKVVRHESSELFDPNFMTANVKRWYPNAVDPDLLALFETFNPDGLPLTNVDAVGPDTEPPVGPGEIDFISADYKYE